MDTKTKIVYSAIDLFSKKGFTETTVKEIATAAGIKPASLYNHFESKKEILDVILDMYVQHTKSSTLDAETIDERVETEDAKTLLASMFYRYNKNEADKFTKILKIILHEQYRNEQVGNFVKAHIINFVEDYIDSILKKLIEKKKIPPINHTYIAKVLNAICITSSLEYCHFAGTPDFEKYEQILMDDLIGYIISLVLAEDEKSQLPPPGVVRWIQPGNIKK